VLEERADGALCIASQERETSVGDATQIRFEAALLRMEEMEQKKQKKQAE
jgi:hypothetical protein